MKKIVSVIVLIVGIVVIGAILFLNSEFMKIDSCLDLGGAWDYTNKICSSECLEKSGEWVSSKKECVLPEYAEL